MVGRSPGPRPTPRRPACSVQECLIPQRKSGSRGTRADAGVCPTFSAEQQGLGKLCSIRLLACEPDVYPAGCHSGPALSARSPKPDWLRFSNSARLGKQQPVRNEPTLCLLYASNPLTRVSIPDLSLSSEMKRRNASGITTSIVTSFSVTATVP